MMAQSLQEKVNELRILGTDKQNVEVKSGVGKSIRPELSAFSNELVASCQVEHTEPLRSPKQGYRMASS